MLFATHDAPLNAIAITPDGTQIIVGADNGIIIWDRVTAREVRRLTGHTTRVRAIAITPTGRQIISASSGGTVRVWDRVTGEQIGNPFAGHSGLTVALTPDGNQIVSGNDDGELVIWDRTGSDEYGRLIPVHNGNITAVATFPDGTRVASAGPGPSVQVTNLATGESTILGTLSGMTVIGALVVSPDGTRIIDGGDAFIHVWETAPGLFRSSGSSVPTGRVHSLAITVDSSQVASANDDGTVQLWDPTNAQPIGEPFIGHNGPVHAVAFTPDGGQIVSAGRDGTVQIWDRPVRDVLRGHKAAVFSLAFDPAGDRIVSGSKDGTVGISDRTTGQLTETLTGHTGSVNAVAVTPDGRIVSGCDDRTLRIWDGGTVSEVHTDHLGGIRALATDENTIVSAGWDQVIHVWDREGQPAVLINSGHAGGIRSIALTPDGAEIISGGADGVVNTWDRGSGTAGPMPSLAEHHGKVYGLAVTPDGSQVVSGSEDGLIRIWDRRTGELARGELAGHSGAVWTVAITPDGRRIVSGGEDGTVRIWNLETGQPLYSLGGHVGGVYAIALNGTQVISGGEDATVRVWELPTSAGLGALPLAEVVSDLESVEDRLGITGDVHTIAAVVAALSTRPPLSVALLGDWGIGKSSFMRQVSDRVEELARLSSSGRSAFAANVRQVRFNAWHYSDDHLWVGLVEHLFRELAKPADRDEEADRRHELEEELTTRQAERERLDEDLQAVERNRGLLAPLRSAQVARATVAGLWRELRSGGWRTWVALLVVAVGAAGIVFSDGVLRWLGGVVAVVGPVVVAWKKLSGYTEVARRRLAERKSEVDADIKAVEEELSRVDPARRLDKLLKEISTADRYESYRGLTGRIHHDLRRLSDDLAAAREKWDGSGAPPLQRIVLYVDDLDRCTPSRVVDVLQAVNLLLTMELFVVVVAVDPRWLLKSLDKHHEGQFHNNAVAYLDKIFHIPVALRPMGGRAAGYLRSLLPADETPAPQPIQQVPRQRQPEASKVPDVVPQAQEPVQRPATKVVVRPAAPDLNPEGLRLRSTEKEFLERLTPLLETPRAIKKLVNLYRLLRLGVGEDRLGEFIGGEQGGPYQAAALLLAALVGAPHEARAVLEQLAKLQSGKDIVDVMPDPRLRDLIVRISKDVPVHKDAGTYRQWATTVARYGFETYDLFAD